MVEGERGGWDNGVGLSATGQSDSIFWELSGSHTDNVFQLLIWELVSRTGVDQSAVLK